jgi:hypothetical protein
VPQFAGYLYNTLDEVERAVEALAAIVSVRSGASDSLATPGSRLREAV